MAEIIPVLLGGDLNTYNLARAFHEAYSIKCHVFGRYALSATKYSSLIIPHVEPKLNDIDVLAETLNRFAHEHDGATFVLFGCTDDYVSLIVELREAGRIPDSYKSPHPSLAMREMFAEKADFYEACDKYGIPHPKTVIIKSADELPRDLGALGFDFPIVIKPSSSAEYWRHEFPDMYKVFFADSQKDVESIVSRIFGSGYNRRIIIQERVPGTDGSMRVLTTYSGSDGKVKMMCLGHVLLEEHTPHGLGNHAAIITDHAPSITAPFRAMLDDVGYTGFCNFDIRYDARDGRYLALDMNLRQGRSNYYVTAAGANVAEIVVRDLVFGEDLGFTETNREVLWHSIPFSVVKKYADRDLAEKAKSLRKDGRAVNSYYYMTDLCRRPVRIAELSYMMHRQKQKYKKYMPKNT